MNRESDAWRVILQELESRRAFASRMGGAERLERQHRGGRLDARQRIERLFDAGSFSEIGAFAGGVSASGGAPAPADALIAGFGRIDGRPVLAAAEDFTVLGGSIGDAGADKRYRLTQLAAQERVPIVFMIEGAGHRLTNTHAGRRPNDLQGLAELSGLAPMVCLVMGPAAGHSALTAPLCDFVVMTSSASLFAAGPPLVKAAIGETVSKEDLGGPPVHIAVSGVAHNLAADDASAIDLARRYLGYFPGNAWERAARRQGPEAGPRRLESILELVDPDPRRAFRMSDVIELLADAGSVLAIQPAYGAAIITALARLGGHSVALVANDPSVGAGAVDAAAADKAAHFIAVVDAFHLPLVFLADNPGVLAGSAAERSGVLRHAARMFAVQHRVRGPKFHVTLRKAFGFGSSLMAMNPFDGQTLSLAFPAIALGAMPAGSGAAAAKLDEPTRERVSAEQGGGAYPVADRLGYDDVIDPRELRNALLAGLDLASARLTGAAAPIGQHGILP